jgi:hypothetical protein
MNSALANCPVCGRALTVERYHCESCETSIEGRFESHDLPGLSAGQIEFVRIFVRCEGKINRMEAELGLSYPTIRNRLHDVIRAMGYEPGRDESPLAELERRRSILNELDAGRISADEALQTLRS